MLRKDIIRPAKGSGTADAEEIARFDALAASWWDPGGRLKAAHRFNAARVPLLIGKLAQLFGRRGERPLAGLRVLDAGCGVGFVAEPLAKAGAAVTAIDASGQSIAIAKRHAAASELAIDYRLGLPEDLIGNEPPFDAVVSLEVVEHVGDLPAFLNALAQLTRTGGVLAIGTLNRTAKSLLLAKAGAEYVLRWLPIGTHDWRKFVRPAELDAPLRPRGLEPVLTTGLAFDPLAWRWREGSDISVNYLRIFRRATA